MEQKRTHKGIVYELGRYSNFYTITIPSFDFFKEYQFKKIEQAEQEAKKIINEKLKDEL